MQRIGVQMAANSWAEYPRNRVRHDDIVAVFPLFLRTLHQP